MRKFVNSFGEEVDLDDPKTYENLQRDINELRTLMLSNIGYSYCYMNYWHKDVFSRGKQKKRVEKLIKNFTENERENMNNIQWYKEQVYIFDDEIENMC